MTNYSEDQIQKISELGSVWVSNDGSKQRVYFNDLRKRMFRGCHVKIEFYNTGNVSAAWENGKLISNADGKRWLQSVPEKFYFDLADNRFHWTGGDRETALGIRDTILQDAGIEAVQA